MGKAAHIFCQGTLLVLIFLAAMPSQAFALKITMKDGRILDGRLGMVGNVAETPFSNGKKREAVDVKPILIVDDGLRRTFVSKRQVRQTDGAGPTSFERIRVPQPVAGTGAKIGSVGAVLQISPFDEFGRRIFEMTTTDGPAAVVQGISEITPVYTKVEGLKGRRSLVWDMRVATSTIPRETLSKVLQLAIDPEKVDDRLKIVRLYVQSERYPDALAELEAIIAKFPEEQRLKVEAQTLRQMGARRMLKELEMRAAAGQHQFVLSLLQSFPKENVAGETLEKVKEIQARFVVDDQRGKQVIETFDKLVAQLENSQQQEILKKFREELVAELNYSTLVRMGAFLRLADDDKLAADQKLAMAVSGWLMGSNSALENLSLALELYKARDLVRSYFNEPLRPRREALLKSIRACEGSVERVSQMIALMKPPVVTEPQGGEIPGYYKLQVPAVVDGELDVNYLVQLPPEYDPHRRYPTVVTLNGGGTTLEQQLTWWTGDYSPKFSQRLGQATRQGYIVIAVDWQKSHQTAYQYSEREHMAVLTSLRDVCRRFSVDTDRVFLSGHDTGGDAAWDIGLAHPDLWAGVIPIVSVSDRYVTHYWKNAKYVPLYFVAGELDGAKMMQNAINLDRYLRPGYDTTVVEYLGRGHEHFQDEIQRIFDWMGRRRRDFYCKQFDCRSMRNFDNFFWWLELDELPQNAVVDPGNWPPQRPLSVMADGKVNKETIFVKTSAERVTVWLSPSLIDFKKSLAITIKGRRMGALDLTPNLEVLLEDARSRSDRQHPFWCKVVYPSAN